MPRPSRPLNGERRTWNASHHRGPSEGSFDAGAVPELASWRTRVIGPERGERLGHGSELRLGEATTELALDQDVVVDERRVMAPATLFGQHDLDAATIARDSLATDQPGGLDPVDKAGEPAPGEQRSSFELLHPQAIIP